MEVCARRVMEVLRAGSAMSVTEVRDGSLRELRDGSLREVRDGSLREVRESRSVMEVCARRVMEGGVLEARRA